MSTPTSTRHRPKPVANGITGSPPVGVPGAPGAPAGIVGPVRRLPNQRAIVGGLLVTTATLLLFALSTRQSGQPRTTYLVATRPVAVGAVVTPGDVRPVPMYLPVDQASHAFRTVSAVDGSVALGPIRAGDLITSGAVSGRHDGSRQVLLSFGIDQERAANGTLRAGDRVDIYATYGTGSTARTAVVVRHATLVDDPASGQNTGLGASGSRQVVTVGLASLDDALHLAHAARAGELTLVQVTGFSGGAYSAPAYPPAAP